MPWSANGAYGASDTVWGPSYSGARFPRPATCDPATQRIRFNSVGFSGNRSIPMPSMPYELTHLDALESEAIHIMREVAAEFERPVLLFSGGKDSIVLLRLAEKAFWPGRF